VRRVAVVLGTVAAGLLAAPLTAQSFGGRIGVANARLHKATATDTLLLSGLAFSLEGAANLGPATLSLRYLQGGLSGDDPTQDRGLVDGQVLLWVAPVRWAAVGVGPHLQAQLRDGVSEQRAVLWELHGQGNARLFEDLLTAYGELWTVFSGSYAPSEPFDNGVGLEGGLRLTAGRFPFSARLRYRVERADLGNGTRRETIEQIGLLVGIGRH
jgi:hypothetical protein